MVFGQAGHLPSTSRVVIDDGQAGHLPSAKTGFNINIWFVVVIWLYGNKNAVAGRW